MTKILYNSAHMKCLSCTSAPKPSKTRYTPHMHITGSHSSSVGDSISYTQYHCLAVTFTVIVVGTISSTT